MRRFVLDSNALWDRKGLVLLRKACRKEEFQIVVPSLVLAERMHQVRRRRQNPEDLRALLDTYTDGVLPFTRRSAIRSAHKLWRHLDADPCQDDPDVKWKRLKHARLTKALGAEVPFSKNRSYPATVDFYLGAQLLGRGDSLLVTRDCAEDSEFTILGLKPVPVSMAVEIAEGRRRWPSPL